MYLTVEMADLPAFGARFKPYARVPYTDADGQRRGGDELGRIAFLSCTTPSLSL